MPDATTPNLTELVASAQQALTTYRNAQLGIARQKQEIANLQAALQGAEAATNQLGQAANSAITAAHEAMAILQEELPKPDPVGQSELPTITVDPQPVIQAPPMEPGKRLREKPKF